VEFEVEPLPAFSTVQVTGIVEPSTPAAGALTLVTSRCG
jgi:hypothetical protein